MESTVCNGNKSESPERRIVLELDNGFFRGIYFDGYRLDPTDIWVIDTDIGGLDPEEITSVECVRSDGGFEERSAQIYHPDFDTLERYSPFSRLLDAKERKDLMSVDL